MTEIKNKRLKLSLISILLIIGGFIWVINMIGGFYKLTQLNYLTKSEINYVITRDSTPNPKLEFVKGKMLPGIDIYKYSKPNEEILENGKKLFISTCASCHGEKGLGDGAGGAVLNPKPRNFHSSENWINGMKFSEMFKTLEEGIPGSGMVAYDFLPITDRLAVIHYIRNLAGNFPEITNDELSLLTDTYNLSSEHRGASQIPLSIAESKIISEKSVAQNVNKLISLNKSYNQEPMLLDNIISCKIKAFTTLSKNTYWEKDINTFYMIISSDINNNGFNSNVLQMNRKELSTVYNLLKNFYNKNI